MQEAMLSRSCGVLLGSDCCRSPCTGMHYSQLISSSGCHHQRHAANNSSLQLSPSAIFLFLKRKRKVFRMTEGKKAFLGNSSSIKDKATIHSGCLCVWPREQWDQRDVFHRRIQNAFPWIHSRTWLEVSQETVRQSDSDTQK